MCPVLTCPQDRANPLQPPYLPQCYPPQDVYYLGPQHLEPLTLGHPFLLWVIIPHSTGKVWFFYTLLDASEPFSKRIWNFCFLF